jgi:O-methyltransferase/methyltransferase family protein
MSERTPESMLWDLMRGAMATRTIAVVSELRVADALADGPRHVEEVAREVGADPDTLHRLLRALASEGVFAEEQRGVFRNSPASELLRGLGWDDFAHLFGGVWYRSLGELGARTHAAVFPRIYGDDFWGWLAVNPSERASFDRAMSVGGTRRVEQLAALEWRGDETVVDVGGGNGSLLRDLIDRVPGLRGIVFDLPETNRDEAIFDERLSFVAGSFLERVPQGDAYVLSGILHDWEDERAAVILRTIRAAAPTEARVLVLDSVVPAGNEPDGAKWLDVLMLTLLGGRERDEEQWRALLGAAGFEPVRIGTDLIEVRLR